MLITALTVKAQISAVVSAESVPNIAKQLFELMLPTDPHQAERKEMERAAVLKAHLNSGPGYATRINSGPVRV